MTRLLLLLLIILSLDACKTKRPLHPQFPDINLIQAERMHADQDDDDIPDVAEIDKTRHIIQVPKLRLSPKTSVDLTFFLGNGQANVRTNAAFNIIEAPVLVIDVMAETLGKGQEVIGDFFKKMAELENCWVMKDLFHAANLPKASEKILRISIQLNPEVSLEGVPELKNIFGIKIKAFSIGEDGDVAYFNQTPQWQNEFKEEIEVLSIDNNGGYKNGSIILDIDQGHGLEFLLGRKRQLGLCIDDFSYELNKNKRKLSQVVKKTKQGGIALNYSNGLKFSKIYYAKGRTLSDLFTSMGKEFEFTSDGKFVLDSRWHLPFELAHLEHLMNEDLWGGTWIPVIKLSREKLTGQTSVEQLSDFLKTDFAPGMEIGMLAVPNYKILKGVYGNTHFIVESRDQLKLPNLAPGGEFDLILSAQESVPSVSEAKLISVQACVKAGRNMKGLGEDCGDDYLGWCGVYHRDLVHLNKNKILSIENLNDIIVNVGQQSISLKYFVDERFTFLDSLGRIHFRLRGPLTLDSMTWNLPKLSKDYQITFGFDHFENCDHRRLGSNFRFLNYAGTVTGNQKSHILWQLQTQ